MKTKTTYLSGGIALQDPHGHTQPQAKTAILLIGKPCSGKSVVAKRLQKEFKAQYYSSSTALRAFANTYNKPQIIQEMDQGDIVSDITSIKLVSGWHYQDLVAHRTFGVLDGWGRTDDELEYALARLKPVDNLFTVFLDGEDETLIRRANERKRGDDQLLLKRINGYNQFFEKLQNIATRKLGQERVCFLATDSMTEEQVFGEICQTISLENLVARVA